MSKWLIFSPDGAHTGPVVSADLVRAIRSGIMDAKQQVARSAAPSDFRPANTFPEVASALAAAGGAEADDPVLRTLIATPAELASLRRESGATDDGPRSVDEMRSFAPKKPAPVAEEPPHPADEDEGGERTLIAASPFDDADMPPPGLDALPPPYSPPVPPAPAARPAAGRRPSIPDAGPMGAPSASTPPGNATRRPSLADYQHPPPSITEAQPPTARGATRIIDASALARHRTYLAISFSAGLVGGLVVIGLIYAIVAIR